MKNYCLPVLLGATVLACGKESQALESVEPTGATQSAVMLPYAEDPPLETFDKGALYPFVGYKDRTNPTGYTGGYTRSPVNAPPDNCSGCWLEPGDGLQKEWPKYWSDTVSSRPFGGRGLVYPDPIPNDWRMIAQCDLDGNGLDDILWRNQDTGQMSLWSIKDIGDYNLRLLSGVTVQPNIAMPRKDPTTGLWTGGWKVLGCGRFDNERPRRASVIWQNTDTGQVAHWKINGQGAVDVGGYWVNVPREWSITDIGDADGDGVDDILWLNSVSGQVGVWWMNNREIKAFKMAPFTVPQSANFPAGLIRYPTFLNSSDANGTTFDKIAVRSMRYGGKNPIGLPFVQDVTYSLSGNDIGGTPSPF